MNTHTYIQENHLFGSKNHIFISWVYFPKRLIWSKNNLEGLFDSDTQKHTRTLLDLIKCRYILFLHIMAKKGCVKRSYAALRVTRTLNAN